MICEVKFRKNDNTLYMVQRNAGKLRLDAVRCLIAHFEDNFAHSLNMDRKDYEQTKRTCRHSQ